MNYNHLLSIGLKIFGFYVLTFSFHAAIFLIEGLVEGNISIADIITSVIKIIVFSLMFWLLTLKTNWIISKISSSKSSNTPLKFHSEQFLELAIIILGGIILIFAIWSSLTLFSLHLSIFLVDFKDFELKVFLLGMIKYVLEFIFGLVLITKRVQLANLLRKL